MILFTKGKKGSYLLKKDPNLPDPMWESNFPPN